MFLDIGCLKENYNAIFVVKIKKCLDSFIVMWTRNVYKDCLHDLDLFIYFNFFPLFNEILAFAKVIFTECPVLGKTCVILSKFLTL